MTAKEKADTLYWKYYQLVADGSHPEEKAKECALNSVNEILNILSMPNIPKYYPIVTNEYWQQVKQEIEKL
jgi:hypothetical protein